MIKIFRNEMFAGLAQGLDHPGEGPAPEAIPEADLVTRGPNPATEGPSQGHATRGPEVETPEAGIIFYAFTGLVLNLNSK